MKTCRLLPAALLALLALFFATTVRGDDLKALEGTWKVETAQAGGQTITSSELDALVLKITGDRYELTTKDGKDGGSIKLDETQKPKAMDSTDTEGFDAGKTVKAIYEVNGDTFRACYALDGGDRPTEFSTKEGSPWLLITFRRVKTTE